MDLATIPMRTKTYKIDIAPIAWERVQYNKKTKHFFDGQHKDKLMIGLFMAKQHKNEPPFSSYTKFDAHFFMPIPKLNTAKAKRVITV